MVGEGEGEGEGESEGVVVKKWSGVGERCKCIFPPVDANAEFHSGVDCVVWACPAWPTCVAWS